jgi:hypothetical protein
MWARLRPDAVCRSSQCPVVEAARGNTNSESDVRKAFKILLAVGTLIVTAAPLSAQSAADVVDSMMSEYARRAENVDNYTLVQDAMGFETVSYFVKEMDNGRPVFQLQRTSAGGIDMGGSPGEGSLDELYSMGEELAERAAYLGVRSVNDYDVHVLEVADFTGMGFGQNVTPDSEFTPTNGTVYLDVDTYAPRMLEFEGEMTNQDGVHLVTSTVEMGDYREVEGMLVAYRTVVSIEGLGAAIDPETRAQFEQMQRELENMPPAQREMVESMMADQLAQFQAMMEGDDTPMTVQMLVREVRVNEGPPSN